MKKVIIVGAGLAGSYMAYAMGKKGYEVQVFEKRPDPRKSSYGSGRSINLVVSHRGWTALAYAGIEEEIRKIVSRHTGVKSTTSKATRVTLPTTLTTKPFTALAVASSIKLWWNWPKHCRM